MTWQLIETAPRNGTRVIVYEPEHDEQFVVAWMTSLEEGDGAWVISRSLGANPIAFVCRQPSHWHPRLERPEPTP